MPNITCIVDLWIRGAIRIPHIPTRIRWLVANNQMWMKISFVRALDQLGTVFWIRTIWLAKQGSLQVLYSSAATNLLGRAGASIFLLGLCDMPTSGIIFKTCFFLSWSWYRLTRSLPYFWSRFIDNPTENARNTTEKRQVLSFGNQPFLCTFILCY